MRIIERIRRWWALRQIKRQRPEKFYYVFPLSESLEEFWETDEEVTFTFDISITADGAVNYDDKDIDYVA